MRRRDFLKVFAAMAPGWPLLARAQQPAMPVIGFLSPTSPDPNVDRLRAFRQGLKDTGYIEGENVAIVLPSGVILDSVVAVVHSSLSPVTGGSATTLSHRRLGLGPLPVMSQCGVRDLESRVAKDTQLKLGPLTDSNQANGRKSVITYIPNVRSPPSARSVPRSWPCVRSILCGARSYARPVPFGGIPRPWPAISVRCVQACRRWREQY